MTALYDFIIVGNIPPPTGGVNVSVGSLYASLIKADMKVKNISSTSFFDVFKYKSKYIHFNYSKPYKRFFSVIIARLTKKKSIFTVHGNNFNLINPLNFFSVLFSHRVMLLNDNVLKESKKYPFIGDRFRLITPILEDFFDKKTRIREEVDFTDKKLKLLLYAGNNAVINGKEVYGVSFILDFWDELYELGYELVILDPNKVVDLPKHSLGITHLNGYFDFKDVLSEIDVYLRPTSTDGQSIAILEALYFNVPVLASDAVPRPQACYKYNYNSKSSFVENLISIKLNVIIDFKLDDVRSYLEKIGYINEKNL